MFSSAMQAAFDKMLAPTTAIPNSVPAGASAANNIAPIIVSGSQQSTGADRAPELGLPTPMPSAPGGSRTDTLQNPAATPVPSTGPGGTPAAGTSWTDMSGKMFSGNLIPQGWSMDNMGNWKQTGDPAATATNPYNPSPGVYPYGAPKYGADPYSSNPADYAATAPHDVNTVAGGGIPGLAGNSMLNDPNQVSNLNQLIYSAGAAPGSPASNPTASPNPSSGGVPQILTGGFTPPYTSPPAPGLTPDQMLAYNSGNTGYLQSIVANGGAPIDQTQAWQTAIAAMQHQQDTGMANLKAQFGASGNRFSTAFGSAASDFQNQNTLSNQAMIAQMMTGAQENAANRMTSGSTTLANNANQNLSQLSSQDFQAAMQATGNNLQAALAMLQTGYGAASQLNQGAIAGAQGLFGAENTAGLTAAQQYQQYISMGLSSSQALAALSQSNTQLGANLGGQQQTISQTQLNSIIQQYMQGLPQYNPLNPYFQQGANQTPTLFTPQYSPSQLGSILGGLGSIAGMTPTIISAISKLFSNGGVNIPGIGGGSNIATPPFNALPSFGI